MIFSFPLLLPFPRPCPTQHMSLYGMHDIKLNNNHKKRLLEFGASVVSKEGQLQTWISLQIKESLWGRNPVRHSLGRPYKGYTLNPIWVQLNEITPVMCDTLWFFIFHCIPSSQVKSFGRGLIVSRLGIKPNTQSVLCCSPSLSCSLFITSFFFSLSN